jgi:hypothetical protein
MGEKVGFHHSPRIVIPQANRWPTLENVEKATRNKAILLAQIWWFCQKKCHGRKYRFFEKKKKTENHGVFLRND